ncbi:hypothetical protein PGTUg99_006417 [Puccinia graminis f. sp. tritici]|uniref:Secreted protein n=1 Tax=Puccinia graminis f. sp. tritici TaxID=56615 RepID=A0A5B0PPQ8_PUCGR|nr:hypothetical protein PGTUg99_006417 [Puccinia graminis f. sp. tritici]
MAHSPLHTLSSLWHVLLLCGFPGMKPESQCLHRLQHIRDDPTADDWLIAYMDCLVLCCIKPRQNYSPEDCDWIDCDQSR